MYKTNGRKPRDAHARCEPGPSAGQVLVKLLACGICGSDDATSLVTATVGIDRVAHAFTDFANPERHTKIIVEPWR
jgi:threonine dehydrogenase-like Zn-dependent dehydrogenase